MATTVFLVSARRVALSPCRWMEPDRSGRALDGARRSGWRRTRLRDHRCVARSRLDVAVLSHGAPVIAEVQPFYSRPFASIATRGFAAAIAACIRDPGVRLLLDRPWIGAIDQFSDSTDLLEASTLRRAIRSLYV